MNQNVNHQRPAVRLWWFFLLVPLPIVFIHSIILIPFAPIPWLLFFAITGNAWRSVSLVASVTLITVALIYFVEPLRASLPFYGVVTGLVGIYTLILIGVLARRLEIATATLSVVGIVFLLAIAGASLAIALRPSDWWDFAVQSVAGQLTQAGKMMEEINPQQAIRYKEFFASPRETASTFLLQSPFMILNTTLIMTVAHFIFLARNPLVGLKLGLIKRPSQLLDWQAPPIFVWLAIATGIAWSASWQLDLEAGLAVSSAMLQSLGIVFALQGTSLILNFLRRLRVGPFLRIVVLCIFLYPLVYITAGLGLFDQFFDFRRKYLVGGSKP